MVTQHTTAYHWHKDMLITPQRLSRIFYDANEDAVYSFGLIFNQYGERFNIKTPVQVNFFLTQIIAESGYDLVATRENLNYSCEALVETFSYYQDHQSEAEEDGRCDDHDANQLNIGDKAYANRMGNGSVESGDGYNFRGGGYFQLTGRDNYTANTGVIARSTNLNITADNLAARIDNIALATQSAMAYWLYTGCGDCSDIDCVTGKINYSTDTYGEREEIYQEVAAQQ
jgi:predicted chitinase